MRYALCFPNYQSQFIDNLRLSRTKYGRGLGRFIGNFKYIYPKFQGSLPFLEISMINFTVLNRFILDRLPLHAEESIIQINLSFAN